MSIVRWIMFTSHRSHEIPSAATLIADTVFGLSGAANVFLLVYARPGLLLLRPRIRHCNHTTQSTTRLTTNMELAVP
jgi:hypothetical protein